MQNFALAARPFFTSFQAQSDIFRSSMTDDDSDLVTLQPFMDYIDDPSLLQALMESQGVENIDSIEPTGPLSGGTADNNYKGYINWTDGTQTKVQIKGSRSTDAPPTSYREALFYSRVTETFADDVTVPYSYTAVADVDSGDGLFVNEFMTGYTSLQDVYNAFQYGTLDDIGFSGFNITENTHAVFELIGHFAASHWTDEWLQTQFYLKGYDWSPYGNSTVGQSNFNMQKNEVKIPWTIVKAAAAVGNITIDDNLKECMDQIMDIWTWENFQAELDSTDYFWGLTHGDFHPGQVMIDNETSDMILLDWEFSGFSNPGIDIATWVFFFPSSFLMPNFDSFLESYWNAIASEGVDVLNEYPFEKLRHDVIYYGTSHTLCRFMFFAGAVVAGQDFTTTQLMLNGMANWLNQFELTAQDMAIPMYELF